MAFQTKMISTVEGFLALEKSWHELFTHSGKTSFYLSYHWFYIILKLWDDPKQVIHMIYIFAENQPIAIIPTCIRERHEHFFSVRTLEVIGNIYTPLRGFIVRKGNEQPAAEALADLLTNSAEWDMIRFDDMPESDSFLNILADRLRTRGMPAYVTHQYDNMVIDLSSMGDSGKYWRTLSQNLRQGIRRCIHKLNKAGRLDIVLTMRSGQDLDRAIRDDFAVYEKSWKIKESDQEWHVRLFEYLAQNGFLRLVIMYHSPDLDGSAETPKPFPGHESSIKDGNPVPTGAVPIATFFYLVYGNTAYFLKTAYREDYAQYSPGSVLKWFLIKWLIDEDRIAVIDFQKGDDAYKFKWAHFHERRVLCKIANRRSLKARLLIWAQYEVSPFVLLMKNKFSRF